MASEENEEVNPFEGEIGDTRDDENVSKISTEDLEMSKKSPVIEADDFLTEMKQSEQERKNEISQILSSNTQQKPSTFQQEVVIHDEFAYFRSLAERVVASKLTPRGVDTVEKVIVILQTGKELGLPGMAALNNIHVIEGRPTLGIHAVNALIKRAGIDWQTLEDYVPVTKKLVQGDKETEQTVDYRTAIKFFRRGITGQIIEETVTYTFRDAQTAGLTTKDNWKKYPKLMLWNRCFVIGARRVAPDAILGMYETSELGDVHNVEYQLEETKF